MVRLEIKMNTERRAAWTITTAEVYERIYDALQASLSAGTLVPVRLGGGVRLITKPSLIRQGYSPTEVYIKTESGWAQLERESMDDLAATLGLVGPTAHFDSVSNAIAEEYPVPDEIIKDHAASAGLDSAAKAAGRKRQPTRVVNAKGEVLNSSQEDRPKAGDVIEYKHPTYLRSLMHVKSVLAYRPFEHVWIVSVTENDDRFVIQKIVYEDTETEHWSIYLRR